MESVVRKKVFLSYCSKDTCIADMIDASLCNQLGDHVQVARYTRDVGYRDSFKDFMNTIGAQDYVVAIVSDNYLKSEACMYEAGEVVKNHMMSKKLLFVILQEEDRAHYPLAYKGEIAANIYSNLGRVDYVLYWQNKYDQLEKKINSIVRNEAKVEMLKDLRLLSNIVNNDISQFMEYLSDARGISLTDMLEGDFEVILKSIDKDYQNRNKHQLLRIMNAMAAMMKVTTSESLDDFDSDMAAMVLEAINEQREKNRRIDSFSQIGKLHDMLEKAGIPHKYQDKDMVMGGKQIVYYGHKKEPEPPFPGAMMGAGWGAVCSVIADGYGSKEGLLEISGLLTDEEYERGDSVVGYLNAENVFNRIKSHFESELDTNNDNE